MTPTWLLDAFTAVMLTVAALSAARIAASRRPWRPRAATLDTDIAHLLMAIAMAGMLTPTLQTLPDGAWSAVFAALTAWFAVRVVGDARANGIRALASGHCAPHLVHGAAMLYMFLALGAPAATIGGGMAGMSAPNSSSTPMLEYPTLAFALGLVLVGYTVWDLDHLSGGRYRAPGLSASSLGVPVLGTPAPIAPVPGTPTRKSSVSAADGHGHGSDDDPPTAGRAPESVVPKPEAGSPYPFLLVTGMTVGCRIAMGVTMALMLFVMI